MTQPSNTSAYDFYRQLLIEAFSMTAKFSTLTGRVASDVLGRPEFEVATHETKLGSLDAARRVGEMAVVHLGGATKVPGEWWRDLCNYERACFLQRATTESGPPVNRPRRGVSATSVQFGWSIPKLLTQLKSGQTITDDLRQPTTLLFSRDKGNVRVVEIGGNVERVFRCTNGLRTVEQIADAAGVGVEETSTLLDALAQIGAVVLAVY